MHRVLQKMWKINKTVMKKGSKNGSVICSLETKMGIMDQCAELISSTGDQKTTLEFETFFTPRNQKVCIETFC